MYITGYKARIQAMAWILLDTFSKIYGIHEHEMKIFRHYTLWPERVKLKAIDWKDMCVK